MEKLENIIQVNLLSAFTKKSNASCEVIKCLTSTTLLCDIKVTWSDIIIRVSYPTYLGITQKVDIWCFISHDRKEVTISSIVGVANFYAFISFNDLMIVKTALEKSINEVLTND